MKKVKDSRKRWKQLVTMLLVTALLVTGTPDIVGLASEGTQEQVTTAADQSEGTQAEGQAEAAQEEEAISEEPVEQQDTSVQQDTAAKQENTEKNIENRSTAGTTERSENSQNSHEKDKAASGAKSGGSSTSKVRETEKNTNNAIYPVCLNRKHFHLSLLAKYFKDPDCFYAGVDWHFIHIFVTNSFFRSKILS